MIEPRGEARGATDTAYDEEDYSINFTANDLASTPPEPPAQASSNSYSIPGETPSQKIEEDVTDITQIRSNPKFIDQKQLITNQGGSFEEITSKNNQMTKIYNNDSKVKSDKAMQDID